MESVAACAAGRRCGARRRRHCRQRGLAASGARSSPAPRALAACAVQRPRSRSGLPPPARARVLLASPRSFCAGVDRAIEIVELALEQRGAPIYVRKQIVHNVHVVGDLEERGAVFVEELDEVPDGATVVFSAHGVSPPVKATPPNAGST